LEPQPLLFRRDQLGLALGELGTHRSEPLAVARVEIRLGETSLETGNLLIERLDAGWRCFQEGLLGRAQALALCLTRRRLRRARSWRRTGRGALHLGVECLDALPALRQHIGIAAGIFDPIAVALIGNDRGDGAIEKIAVVTNEQQRSRVGSEEFMRELEALSV